MLAHRAEMIIGAGVAVLGAVAYLMLVTKPISGAHLDPR
jgi:hypothetical protein